jgi:uncharacterized protein (DUF58 family)
MLSSKSTMMATLALLALFLGVAILNSLLVFVSIPLFAYLVLSIVYSDESKSDLVFNRTIEKSTIYEDEEAIVRLEVENAGSKLDFLEITDVVPSKLTIVEGTNHLIIALDRGERFSFSYSVRPKVYGYYEIDRVLTKYGDVQGTILGERIYDIDTHLRVLPKIAYISKINIRPRRTKNWPGEILAKKPGSGMEFYSLRDYLAGDPVRRINWKASSKADGFYTNQFLSELGGDTIIALDARTVSEVGRPPESTITYSTRAAGVIAYRLLRDRNRVGLIALGSRLEKVPPGFGKRQFDRILVSLSMTTPGEVWDISALGRFLSTFFSTMVQIVLISSLNDRKAFDSIIDVASRGFRVLVISPSPIEIEKKAAFQKRQYDESYNIGERVLRIQRQNKLNNLRKFAVVADWNVEQPLTEALAEATNQWNRQKISV